MRFPTNFSWLLLDDGLGEKNVQTGGVVIRCIADNALLIGDCVFISDALKVDKSATQADYITGKLGFVVGGDATDMEVIETDESGLVGTSAAAAEKPVLVCIAGVCYGIAAAAITADKDAVLTADGTTAGRVVIDGTPTAEETVALAIGDAANAGDPVLVVVKA